MGLADLHLHTTASDGNLSPPALVARAAQLGLEVVAITDHDTTAGVGPAMAAGREWGVRVVPGVEISTIYGSEEVHILGYKFDLAAQGLQQALTRLRNARMERMAKIVSRLQQLGFAITREEVLAAAGESSSIGRPHVAMVMVDKGYVRDIKEAFQRWLEPGRPAFVPRYKLSPRQAMDLVHQAGGLAFLAHPGLLAKGVEVARELIGQGLDGIEVWHSEHSASDVSTFWQLAKVHQVLVSGGSDCHGRPGKLLLATTAIRTSFITWL